mmetsp:Transcript_8674/g.11491  ORF Transcript_8674/g.11491 Transcript_8674/m.11491 type:complete len:116 (+) Transcript_8674:159-506(+)|eukprot:CAMPEP_0198137966 /NCGR_PEP_ID=MMETSP1443-20131203/1387_1 /TAXON_ID=186043 /ORGANISM="Entomoneis sp., Strain CCMP2396" /LENGTH=115 /DNA_ID=CAMNT_0043799555 /DNA_START=130 /DNA_END=477 /DNA_ORIENTATION=+
MSEITALLLCKLGGQDGSADQIKAVLEAAGVEANEEQITKLVGDTEGKDINELLAEGAGKVKTVKFGGGGGGGGAAAGGAAAAEVVEEEVVEEEEAPDLGAGDMFGAGDGGGGDY